MEKFKTGNVVRLASGMIVIINKYRTVETKYRSYEVVDYISLDMTNVAGSVPVESTTEEEELFSEDGDKCNCEILCSGCDRKIIKTTRHGINDATFLASNVKKYILKRLTKNFEF